MATLKRFMVAGVLVLGFAGTAMAQISAAEAEQIHARQQIAQMEGVLQQAIQHGADLVYAQLRAVLPDPPRLGSQPRVSGFKLPGYGIVFNIDVPMIQLPILYEVLLREREYRDALAQLQAMRNQWSSMSPGRERDQKLDAINRFERQLGMGELPQGGRSGPNSRSLAVPAGINGAGGGDRKATEDPQYVYSHEVKTALIEAMLTHSQGLNVGPDEWLTLMAQAREANNADPGATVDSSKGIIRVKGSVLTAYRAGTITKEEARKQVEEQEQ